LAIYLSDGRKRESYEKENKDLESLREKFVEFFSEFQSIFESEFGDAYESISFTINNNNELNWK
jgi:hypothetical protein